MIHQDHGHGVALPAICLHTDYSPKSLDKEEVSLHFEADPMRALSALTPNGTLRGGEYRAKSILGGVAAKGKSGAFVAQLSPFKWFDHTSQRGGDCFQYIQERLGVSFPDAVSWLGDLCGIQPSDVSTNAEHIAQLRAEAAQRKAESDAADAAKRQANYEAACKLWAEGVAIHDTLAWTYWKDHRKNDPAQWKGNPFQAMRFHSGIAMGDRRVPALMFRVDNALTGEMGGIHRVFLNDDGSKHLLGKKRLGSVENACIRFGPNDGMIALAEGPETTMRLWSQGATPCWSSIDAGGMSNFPVLPGHVALHIFADAGEVGINAAKRLRERYQKADVWVKALVAPHDDFDADLLAGGA